MGSKYTYSINGQAQSTTTGYFTVVTVATGAGSVVNILEVDLAGEASSSAVIRMGLNRLAGGAPTGAVTSQTPELINPASQATPGHKVATSFASTQGTLSTNWVAFFCFNAFGGIHKWTAAPGLEVVVGTQGAIAYCCLRSASGTSTISGHMITEEA